MSASVTVIIAAFNAQDTVSRAIRSALAQPETAEVIVVDDASRDATCGVVADEAKRDPRVHLIQQETNHGPAAARNRALDVATSDYVAVLDSDDVFLPRRLAHLSSVKNCEMVADNIAFVTPENLSEATEQDWSVIDPKFAPLVAAEFVRGNLRNHGMSRGELGFLKPVLSRDFLEQNKLRYDPSLRLGEDYDLYVRMLLAGARMQLTRRPGYAAVVRSNSLSARHGASELAQLHIALQAHLDSRPQSSDLTRAMQQHLRDIRRKRDHRISLDLRREQGVWAAVRYLISARDRAWPVALQILRDKLNLSKTAADAAPEKGSRLLLSVE
ncbi:glycosyltransferase family 2 protein [uncultured Ruegeria sp.]|uniref:glycosyltransferase family 2 protein n=1 Tax=uncultured Ruegeria sp. TaxID=259304 RepID=UPI002603A4B1|nr:glycosyltransferase family 2 protein [uncultured Ruegeria sp.]